MAPWETEKWLPRSAAEMEDARADIERPAGMIADACRPVVFTGDGISIESGIPDFRRNTEMTR